MFLVTNVIWVALDLFSNVYQALWPECALSVGTHIAYAVSTL